MPVGVSSILSQGLGHSEMLKLRIHNRSANQISMYFDVCRDEYQKCEEYGRKFETMRKMWDDFEKDFPAVQKVVSVVPTNDKIYLVDKQYKHWATAVLFGAMCLEAFIYDYAARAFSDTYMKRYLDKLDLKAKWVVIPKLVMGKGFPTDSQAFQNLSRLVVERNRLVHHKSKPLMTEEEFAERWRKIKIDLAKQNQVVDLKRPEVSFFGLSPYETIIDVLTGLRGIEDEAQLKWWTLEEGGKEE